MPKAVRGQLAMPVTGLIAALVLVACEEQNTYVEPPPPKVTVAKPLVQDVTEYFEATGRTKAVARVEVPARVPGVLQSMHFEVGTPVQEGDLLFVIDPQEYEAAVEAAEAELARAEARETETEKSLARARALITRGNISQAKVDEAEANDLSAKAEILVRKANLTRAKIDLGYTQVRAPLTGRVGRNLVDVGNLVGQEEATILTDITTYDPMYIYFEINERDLLLYMERERGGADEPRDQGAAGKADPTPIEAGLATEQGFPHKGVADFAESGVDPDTGTLLVRGVFENPGRQPVFVPGLFVRVRIPTQQRPDALLVTDRAFGFDQSGRYLLVVNSEGIVEKRVVQVGASVDGLRVVESGLQAGDLVVVNGIQRARAGARVEAKEVDMTSLSASALEAALARNEKEAQGGSNEDTAAAPGSTTE